MNNPKSQFKRVPPLSLCCVLCVTAFARADFVGLVTVNKNDLAASCALDESIFGPPPFPLTVCNVAAKFDANDRLHLVDETFLAITGGDGSDRFYQHPIGGGDGAPRCDTLEFYPAMACDSFVTFGRKCIPPEKIDTLIVFDLFFSQSFNSTCGICQFNGLGLCVSGIGPCDEDECVAGFCDVTGGPCPNGDVDCLGPGECTGGSDSCKPDTCLQNDCIRDFCAITGDPCYPPIIFPCPVVPDQCKFNPATPCPNGDADCTGPGRCLFNPDDSCVVDGDCPAVVSCDNKHGCRTPCFPGDWFDPITFPPEECPLDPGCDGSPQQCCNGHIFGGWFAYPLLGGKHPGDAGQYDGFEVLILQASVQKGLGVAGPANIFWKHAVSGETVISPVQIECLAECIHGAPCDDGNPCTENDTCGDNGECQPGDLVDCSMEGNPCNIASCDPAQGEANCLILEPCPADFDGDGDVDAGDLAEVLSSWGECGGCPADFDGNDMVEAADLAELLSEWGP